MLLYRRLLLIDDLALAQHYAAQLLLVCEACVYGNTVDGGVVAGKSAAGCRRYCPFGRAV